MRSPEEIPRPNGNESQQGNRTIDRKSPSPPAVMRGRGNYGTPRRPPIPSGHHHQGHVPRRHVGGTLRSGPARGTSRRIRSVDDKSRERAQATKGLREEAIAVHQVRMTVVSSAGAFL